MNLDEIEARANGATPGPWRDRHQVCSEVWGQAPDSQTCSMQIARVGHAQFDVLNAAFIAAARTDVPALIARVRELEAARDHERALLECAPWATYSEGETLLRAQAAEANQRAAEFYDRHEAIKAEAQKLAEAYAACETRCARQSVIIKRAHGVLADAGDAEVPPLTEHIDEAIRAIVRERDELRAGILTRLRGVSCSFSLAGEMVMIPGEVIAATLERFLKP